MAGLLELLNYRGGKDDLYRVAEDSAWRWTICCRLSKPPRCCRSRNRRAGKAFADADIHDRKRLFREAALANGTLLQQMHSALTSKSDHTMPLEFFRDLWRRGARAPSSIRNL